MRILVPVDGSSHAERALRNAIDAAVALPGTELHILTVVAPIPGPAAAFVPRSSIEDHHREEAEKALASARSMASAAGIGVVTGFAVGQIGDEIVDYARSYGCDRIIMGTRGLGSVAGLLLGSVASRVIHLSDVPVTLVK
ncbi:MAG: universal stress protein [Alphaproteobacteria bacterium]|nr:universal stress protein [Alphaproteobacteria bacterium]